MSSRTYVCMSCRWSRRAEAAHGLNTHLRCPTCGGSLWELGWRWRIPVKTNDDGWKELLAKITREATEWIPRRKAMGEAKIGKIDRKIATVERQSESSKKAERLKQ